MLDVLANLVALYGLLAAYLCTVLIDIAFYSPIVTFLARSALAILVATLALLTFLDALPWQ